MSKYCFPFLVLSKILFENLDGPKLLFGSNLSILCRPGVDFRRFGVPKQAPVAYFVGVFFKNGDFVKIVLPLWWEHSFQGLDLPKIDLEIDCERQRRTTSKKIASDAVSERTFSVPGSFLVDFGVQLGSQDGLFGPTFGRLS